MKQRNDRMGEGEKERSKIRCPTYTQNNDCRSPSKRTILASNLVLSL